MTRGIVDDIIRFNKFFIEYFLIVICRHRLVLTAERSGFVEREVGTSVLDGKLNVIDADCVGLDDVLVLRHEFVGEVLRGLVGDHLKGIC